MLNRRQFITRSSVTIIAVLTYQARPPKPPKESPVERAIEGFVERSDGTPVTRASLARGKKK